ncbi:MAG: hypothetical protein U0183_28475 [Polyangiaceae bacterium]
MRTVSFYSLSRVLQDRLTGSISEGFVPVPLARSPGGPKKDTLWLGVMGGAIVLLLGLFFVGFGSLGSSLSQHGVVALCLYVALIAVAVLAFIASRRHVTEVKCFPLPRGVYLFPACIVDATSAELRIVPTAEATLSGSGPRVTLAAAGKSYTFEAAAGEDLARLVAEGVQNARVALAENDSAKLAQLDPMHEPRFSSPVGPRAPYAEVLPAWQKLGWAVALGVGLVFGVTTYFMRNATSEGLLYSRAKAAGTEAAYRSYLLHGKTHAREVSRVLLPRAALRTASAAGTVEAIFAFKAAYPDTDITDEVDAALHSAMLAELERAKAKGTLGALQGFATSYPQHGLQKELAAAVHAVYEKELARVLANVPEASRGEMSPVLTQLFAALEKGGPSLEVRFRRRPGPKLASADKAIMKTITYNGPVSLISKYFDGPHHKAREEMLTKAVGEKLAEGFDKELVHVVQSAAEPDAGKAEDPFPKVTAPTLFLVHGADWSGHTYTSRKPRVTIVGLNFGFDAVLVLPQDRRTFKTKHDVWKGVTVPQLRETGDGPLEERVYGQMADSAYDAFAKKVVGAFTKN